MIQGCFFAQHRIFNQKIKNVEFCSSVVLSLTEEFNLGLALLQPIGKFLITDS